MYLSQKTPDSLIGHIILTFGVAFVLFGFIFIVRGLIHETKTTATLIPTATSSDIEHAVAQLGANYDILRRQATQGFFLAAFTMVLGTFVIFAGLLGDLFGLADATRKLTSAGGIILEVVSGLGFYLFQQTSRRLDLTSERLHEMWRILAAFKKAEALPEDQKTEVTKMLITSLVKTHLG